MQNIIVGDTIRFEANLKDPDGTAVTDATVSLVVVDGVGSQVLSTTATHSTLGTYQKSQNTTGWGIGPITERWSFTNSLGTVNQVLTNTFRMVGTEVVPTYVSANELKGYYQNIEDYFDGSEDERVLEAFNFINPLLNSLGYKLPIPYGTDGYYDQGLRDWNAWEAVFRIVAARAVSQLQEGEDKPWYYRFKELSAEKWDQFRTKKIVLTRQTGVGEVGIQPGTKVVSSGPVTMETNWEGYGKGFRGGDFPRTWRVQLFGTGTAGEILEGTYRWSMDNGLTWEGTAVTDQAWTHLKDEVYVRFTRGTSAGTSSLFGSGDCWTFNTAPIKLSSGGKGQVRSY
jgi:hypothetical protein